LKTFDDLRNDFEGTFDQESLKSFIVIHKTPLVSEFNQEIANAVFGEQ